MFRLSITGVLLILGSYCAQVPVAARWQKTVDDLARELLSAIRTKDRDKALRLLDTRTLVEGERLEPGITERTLDSWMRRDLPPGTKILIQEPGDLKGFDVNTLAFDLVRVKLQLLDRPEKIVTLDYTVSRPNSLRAEQVILAVVNRDGEYRITPAVLVRKQLIAERNKRNAVRHDRACHSRP